ncbi:response regulator receiver domain-containing protein [Desulfobotulus alkaliphilus]|uniref:Response regulator receiver domain-containing protein n=1 Tax=Desulfobotulus alkaliphilus TaxID=622671 RepID=A0A562S7Y3_9BACT|nr:response regulator [Desulfobotulus alkaliphilus]TWI77489.1 response regulator receiver domain-containing protein [Desulfobotulus alkaliphilus]
MSTLQRIAYVEDETDIQEVAKMALELVGGFSVAVFSSGQEAVEKMAAFAPQLILLDVMMPGLDGPATLKLLREQESLKDVPAIFMTAKVQTHEVSRYKELGAVSVIAKPFDPMTLADQLKGIWETLP